MIRSRIFLIIAVLFILAAYLPAGTTIYSGSTSDGDWMNPGIWWDNVLNVNRLPDSNDTVVFYVNTTTTLAAGNTVLITELYLGGWNYMNYTSNNVAKLVLNGSLEATTYSCVGYCNGAPPANTMQGMLTINAGGNFTCDAGLFVGSNNDGTVNMNGGTLNSQWWISVGCSPWQFDDVNMPGVGTINLNSGTIQTGGLYMGSDASKITVANGVLQVNSDARIPGYIANNQIVAADGYTLNIDYSYNLGYGVRITATGPMKGDMDGNRKIDLKDFAVLAKAWWDGM